MASNPKYVVITPVRDEAAFLKLTIACMVNQSIRPAEWIIVNDGSTDDTGKIIDEAAAEHPWIHPVHRANRGFRKSGGGVVEAFNDGYRTITCTNFDFIVKFDGDLSFQPDYFEKCLARFDAEPKLGVGGGAIYHIRNGEAVLERCPEFHVRGATKIYRKACWDAIGGFWPAPGWDTVDEVKANRLGWVSRNFPEMRLTHHRETGSADGMWKGLVKNGRANYVCGYHPLFMIGKCIRRLPMKPYILGSIALFYGFITGYLERIPQIDDRETIAYLRSQQMGKMLGGQTIWR